MPLSHRDSVDGAFLLDVRNPPELAVERVTGAVTSPYPPTQKTTGSARG